MSETRRVGEANLLGMANQRFEEAAVVWQRVRRNSNALRERTHEAVDEYVVALSKFFKCIVMRSVNPGMLRAYQVARKSNSVAIAHNMHRPWQRAASLARINHELNVLKYQSFDQKILVVNLHAIAPVLLCLITGGIGSAERLRNLGHFLVQSQHTNAYAQSKGASRQPKRGVQGGPVCNEQIGH